MTENRQNKIVTAQGDLEKKAAKKRPDPQQGMGQPGHGQPQPDHTPQQPPGREEQEK